MMLKSLFVVVLFVAVNGKFAEWNEWSSCTADCGSGIATRERMSPPYGTDHCYSAIVQEKACTGKSCKKTANIARSKPTSASSNLYNKYPSSRAVDGNYNTMFNVKSCMHTDKDMKPFLRIDLQNEMVVEKVLIWNREDSYSSRLNNVYVTVGNDPNGFGNKVCGRIGNVTEVIKVDVLCGGILFGRYVHIRIPGQQYLTICEVEVIGAAITNVAKGHSATQSSTHASSYPATKAVDGNRATFSHTNNLKDQWLKINFGQERYIKRVELYPFVGYIYNATLTLGNNENPMLNKVFAFIKDFGKISHNIVNCPPDLKGQYLTVQQVGTNYMRIDEVEAYGY